MVRQLKPGLFRLILIGGLVVILGLVFWLFVWPMISNKLVADTTLNQKTSGPIEQARKLLDEKKCDESIAVLQKAASGTSVSSEKVEYLRSQATTLAECNKVDQAVQIAKEANQIDPKATGTTVKADDATYTASLQNTFTDVALTKTNIGAGYTGEDESLKLKSKAQDFRHLAYLYDISGDFNNAIEYYKKSLDIYKSNPSLDLDGSVSYLENRIAELESR